jgi:hypothetical protein
LGEFCPFGQLLTLGGLLKIKEAAHLFKVSYSTEKNDALILSDIRLGNSLGNFFFTNSSGHPACWHNCNSIFVWLVENYRSSPNF